VVDMLHNVKREKREVIAIMHGIAVDKNTVSQDLSSLHQLALGEIAAMVTAGQQQFLDIVRHHSALELQDSVHEKHALERQLQQHAEEFKALAHDERVLEGRL